MSSFSMPSLVATSFDSQIARNSKEHHTDEYAINEEHTGLVVRRGLPFCLEFDFDDELNYYDLISFVFTSEDYGLEKLKKEWIVKESPRRFSPDQSDDCPIQISRVLLNQGGKRISVTFTTPADAVVSRYNLQSIKVWRSKDFSFESSLKLPIYLLFNPFFKEDVVFMEDESEQQEYVLNDYGRIYKGSSHSIGSKPWFFAQFEDPVLSCAFLLLARSELDWSKWGDPIEVSRTLSAQVNSCDDNGLLVGNWSGDYKDGTAPTHWKGSHRIIREYFETQTPVKFGQCWVFSGCLTSIMRTLGIPCRSVTNFVSAHDTDTNLTVDKYFSEDYALLPEISRDSIWNFHVWNDVWMKRADLGGQFDGWQALDATPQERSEGTFRSGPSSLYAIKHGLVHSEYDTEFYFAEVNGTVRHLFKGKDDKFEEFITDKSLVGQFISTKSVGSDDRMDITDLYKFPEGSTEECDACKIASEKLKIPDRPVGFDETKKKRLMTLDVKTEKSYYDLGQDVPVVAVLTNGGGNEKDISLKVTVDLIRYNGKLIKSLACADEKIKVPAKSNKQMNLTVKSESYLQGTIGDNEVAIRFVIVAQDGRDVYMQTVEIHFFRPKVEIDISGELVQHGFFHLDCIFNNPLKVALTNCYFLIDGPGLKGEQKEVTVSDVKPGEKAQCTFKLSPVRSGYRKFITSFSSNELKGSGTDYSVFVKPAICACD